MTVSLSAAEVPVNQSQPSPAPVSAQAAPASANHTSQPAEPSVATSATAPTVTAKAQQHGPTPEISIPAAAANLAVVATHQSQVQTAPANVTTSTVTPAAPSNNQTAVAKTTPAWNPNAVWTEPATASTTAGAPAPTTATNAPVQNAPQYQVRLIDAGQSRQVALAVKPNLTVGQALGILGVALGAMDKVTPTTTAPVHNGLVISVSRTTCETRVHNEYVPAAMRYKPTSVLRAGAVQVIRYPRPGVVEVTENVWKHDGKEVGTQLVSRRVTAWPVAGEMGLGAWPHLIPNAVAPRYQFALSYRGGSYRDRLLAARTTPGLGAQVDSEGTYAPVRAIMVTATGYSAGPGGGGLSSRTATGELCTYGAVAVDPRVIPLGSKLYIEGYGYGLACDTGGAIRGHRVDLAFDSASAARHQGRRVTRAYILGP